MYLSFIGDKVLQNFYISRKEFACLCTINKSLLQSLDSEDSGCWQIFADNMRQPRLIQCLSVGVWMWLLPLLWSVIVTRAGYKLIFPLQIPVWHRHYAVTILSPPDLKSQTTALRTILPTWANNTTQFKYLEREGIWRWSDLCENIGMFASQTDNNWLAGLRPAACQCSDLSPPILTCFYHILNDWKIFARHLESRLHTTFTFRKQHIK